MKKLIFLSIFVVNFVVNFVISVEAITVDDVFQMYGIASDYIDVESLKNEYTEKMNSFHEMKKAYYSSKYFSNATEIINYTKNLKTSRLDIEKCSLELERLKDCLEALVLIDAPLDDIYKMEKEYRNKKKELNGQIYLLNIFDGSEISFENIDTDISYSEIQDNREKIKKLKNSIQEFEQKEDIGEIRNLKSPTKDSFRITSKFGNRTNPITLTSTENHSGLDLAAPKNTPVLAVFKGKIVTAEFSNSLGNYIIISHGDGLQTLYGHMDSFNVKKGDLVNQYDTIGFVGTTGSSTGYHLHLGVYINGVRMNPEILFRE